MDMNRGILSSQQHERMVFMKCFRSLLMALALTGILCASAGAYTGTFPVEADGQSTGVQACLMVPLRAVAEPLGFTVTWDDGGVLVDNGTLHTRVVIGQDRYCNSSRLFRRFYG